MKMTRDGIIYSITDVADAVGLDANKVWCLAYRSKDIPLPTIKHGKRMCYDATLFGVAVDKAKRFAQ